ncbi:beta-ketoacyl synthase N-terminal-like domain-containing protein [Streptomyces sp. NPDC006617]|uniref:beta-ketoacyl synthase N-terminal-like domain-containing protein n=1 Tax=Streptomyces sp. NPDC006617 TaxID=3155354 RepID=UPI0033B4DEDB
MDPAEIRQLMEDQLRLSRRLRDRIRELEDERRAPVAVVGMGLRLPGGLTSPEAYWDFLRGDSTAHSGIPEDRPGLRAAYDPDPATPGRSYVDTAGFLAGIGHFDAEFFGISRREAKLLDPQQRLLLETAWEALERAGIAVRRADRLPVGVYLGMMASEYGERLEDRTDMSRIDPYYTTGGGLCFGAGRISHTMGFSGPVASVDTACSSSLTALHLALQGLRAGECRYALVCGSNLLLSAHLMVSLCRTRALAPDGRSKSFLASADGYGRGEGVGAVALMRLADAEREGRPVLAVLRGSAMGHDGAASGLTAPNGSAQQEVIGAALADASVDAGELGWIEAHGTGTALGDPIEVGALDAVLGDAVRARGLPLPIGSVKARIGHLEAASGIAALIKTVLMLRHGEIPAAASPDDGPLNPHIPWDSIAFTVPRANQPWPKELPRRVAGINSFGMSGTNVHVVLEAYDPAPAGGGAPVPAREAGVRAPEPHPELITLSARTPGALRELADTIADLLHKTGPDELSALCHTLRSGRAPQPCRVAVTGSTTAELADRLARAARAADGATRRATPLRRVTLRVPDGVAAPAVAALAREFPWLLDGPAEPAGPEHRLAALVSGFGVPVRPGADASDDVFTYPAAEGEGGAAAHRLALLTLLGQLFEAGADLRPDALCAPGTPLVGDLPTYPFQRERYWVDEPSTGVPGDGRPAGEADGAAPSGSWTRERIHAHLLAVLKDALEATDEPDMECSFLEAGGDSFISTLFITKVEERFEVGLTREELPLDLPLRTLIGRLADDIAAGEAAAAEQGRHR